MERWFLVNFLLYEWLLENNSILGCSWKFIHKIIIRDSLEFCLLGLFIYLTEILCITKFVRNFPLNSIIQTISNSQTFRRRGMDEPHDDGRSFRPPQTVLFSCLSSPFAPMRLSSHFTKRAQPVRSVTKLAWVSLQGRIVGAEEASSARAIGGGLSKDEAVAWEMFTPMHRILIVAVVAVATAHNREIRRLKQSVLLRVRI